jgi:hypothetical protein
MQYHWILWGIRLPQQLEKFCYCNSHIVIVAALRTELMGSTRVCFTAVQLFFLTADFCWKTPGHGAGWHLTSYGNS